ncbi:hypothetical protein [Weissella confusa]|uniref:hypothetical protein n=1 Tax=Weissella confusa TaxID=1583 RepID=UPI001FD96C31|nr:hypothetical protein [Weissella confusa]
MGLSICRALWYFFQNGLGNNGVPEYFTLNGRYKVLQRVGSSIEVEMNGESVWLQAAFAK